jgi:hypothetical protein
VELRSCGTAQSTSESTQKLSKNPNAIGLDNWF